MSREGNDCLQRALNEAKKRELEKKYGATFPQPSSTLPPEIEKKWLDYIDEFESKCALAELTTIRRFVGNPVVRALGEIPPDELRGELESLQEILRSNNIEIHFGRKVSDSETYRFLTEEILDREMEDVRIAGMTHNYFYEEFHPDDAEEATMIAEDFLYALFHGEKGMIRNILSRDEAFDADGTRIDPTHLRKMVEQFIDGMASFTDTYVDIIDSVVDGSRAVVRLKTSWSGMQAGDTRIMSSSGESVIRLKRGAYGGWDVVQAMVVGMGT